jgi:hypothetical protein
MADEPRAADPTPRQQARLCVNNGSWLASIAWSLISIAEDVTALRRDSDWQRRHPGRHGG